MVNIEDYVFVFLVDEDRFILLDNADIDEDEITVSFEPTENPNSWQYIKFFLDEEVSIALVKSTTTNLFN